MLSRSAALAILLSAAAALAQTPASQQPSMKSFHIQDFDMTFIYPGDFIPADAKATAPTTYVLPTTHPANPPCVQAPLSVGSATAPGRPVIVISILDDACPSVLHDAQKIGEFTQAQLLRQLQRYGTPTLTPYLGQSTHLFTLDGRSAALTLGSATPVASASNTSTATPPITTYAAKLCTVGPDPVFVPAKSRRQPVGPKPIVCFDFTAHQSDQITTLLALPIIFGEYQPRSLVAPNQIK